jgi:glycerol kinase
VIVETTALGAAYAAGLAIDYWTSLAEIETQWKKDRVFVPAKSFADEYGKWKRAERRTQYWIKYII